RGDALAAISPVGAGSLLWFHLDLMMRFIRLGHESSKNSISLADLLREPHERRTMNRESDHALCVGRRLSLHSLGQRKLGVPPGIHVADEQRLSALAQHPDLRQLGEKLVGFVDGGFPRREKGGESLGGE